MTIYRFKIYNSIGNVFNQGVMVGSREEIERFCRKQIIEAKKQSPCNWEFIIDLMEIHRPKKNIQTTQKH